MPRIVGAVLVACGVWSATPAVAAVSDGAGLCTRRDPLSYRWPVKPFRRAHPVRGNFGDPRTIYWGLQPEAAQGGSFNFHNGVDISAAPGAAVYPVVSGTVTSVSPDEIIVRARARSYQYWHLTPAARPGEKVRALATVLGFVTRPFDHVHLTEIDGGRAVNPLRHLRPLSDPEPPVIRAVELRSEARGRIWLIADVYDYPNLPPPPPWGELPVTPALVQWKLTRVADGSQVAPLRTAADFRDGLPRPRMFWRIYAAGTYQNEPVIGFTHYHVPGRYLFDLTPGGLDTRRLLNGQYAVTVVAANICGVPGRRTERIEIDNGAGLARVARIRQPASTA